MKNQNTKADEIVNAILSIAPEIEVVSDDMEDDISESTKVVEASWEKHGYQVVVYAKLEKYDREWGIDNKNGLSIWVDDKNPDYVNVDEILMGKHKGYLFDLFI